MRLFWKTGWGGLSVLALAACSPPAAQNGAADDAAVPVTLPVTSPVTTPSPAAAPAGTSYREQVLALNERQRTALMMQAIRAAREPCEQVVSTRYLGTENAIAHFIVDCRRAATWLVAIDDTDTATLVQLSPAREVRAPMVAAS